MPSDDALRKMAADRDDDQQLAPAVNRAVAGLALAAVAVYSALGHLFHRLAENWATVSGSAGPVGAVVVLLLFGTGCYLLVSGVFVGLRRATGG
jgi:NADPH-dependent curcumin reductase CurA